MAELFVVVMMVVFVRTGRGVRGHSTSGLAVVAAAKVESENLDGVVRHEEARLQG